MKDFLGYENARNKRNAALYCALIKAALGECDVLVGHHLTFEINGDLDTENEIPSADCLMFDHDLMTKIFGNEALSIMGHLALTPVESRDAVLAAYWECKSAQAQPVFVSASVQE